MSWANVKLYCPIKSGNGRIHHSNVKFSTNHEKYYLFRINYYNSNHERQNNQENVANLLRLENSERKRKRTRRTGFIPIPDRNFEKTDRQ